MSIEIKADLNEAIQTLCEKFGVTTNEVVAEYTKLVRVRGIVTIITCIVFMIIAIYICCPIDTIKSARYVNEFNVYSYDAAIVMKIISSWVIMFLVGGIGIMEISGAIEDIMAPRASAIEKIIKDFT